MNNRGIEAVTLALFLALGGAGLWAASQISGLAFDPLGSAKAPYVISGFVVALSAWAGIRLFLSKSDPKPADDESQDANDGDADAAYTGRDIGEVLAMLGLVVVYVFALFSIGLPFSIATPGLVVATACLLERAIKTRLLLIAVAAGVVIGFGGELLFTRIFFVDLPTL